MSQHRCMRGVSALGVLVLALGITDAGCASSGRSTTAAAPGDSPAVRGLLGCPLGTYVTVEGVRSETGKSGICTFRVDTINGQPLESNIEIWVDNVAALPRGRRLKLHGYESGRYIGQPREVEQALGAARQASWQFQRYFLVVPIDLPHDIVVLPEKS